MRIRISNSTVFLTAEDIQKLIPSFTLMQGRRFSYCPPNKNGFKNVTLNHLISAFKNSVICNTSDLKEVDAFRAALGNLSNKGYRKHEQINNENFLIRIITKIKHLFSRYNREKILKELDLVIAKEHEVFPPVPAKPSTHKPSAPNSTPLEILNPKTESDKEEFKPSKENLKDKDELAIVEKKADHLPILDQNHFNILPNEVKVHIFSFLHENLKDLANLSEVDKTNRELVLDYLSRGNNPQIFEFLAANLETIKLFPKNFNHVESYAFVKHFNVEIVKKFPNLKEATFKTAKLTDQALKAIADSCKHLQTLHLEDCLNITTEGLKVFLEKLNKLKQLTLTRNNIDYSIFSEGNIDFTNLEKLKLYYNKKDKIQENCFLTLATFEKLSKKCPNLQDLDIEENTEGKGDYLKIIGDNYPNIKKLSFELLRGNYAIQNEEDCIYLTKKCRKIEEINLRSNAILSDDFFCALAKNCKNLQKLSVNGAQISDAGLIALIDNHKNLKELILTNPASMLHKCVDVLDGNITQHGIEHLFKNCKNLSRFELATNENIPTEFFKSLKKDFQKFSYATVLTNNCLVLCSQGIFEISQLENE